MHDDYAGLARIYAALLTPVAGGEYVWGIAPFRHMIEARSVDIMIIDLCRVGGLDAMDEGRRHGRGVQPAGGQPRDAGDAPVHLVAAAPNGLTVEYMPWMLPLFEEVPKLENGEVIVPDRPGFGLKFDEDFVKRHGA